jgi:hypothetical protein
MIRPSRRAGRLRRSPRKRRCGGSRRRDGVRSRLREAPASSCGSGTSPSRCSRHVQRGTGVAYRGAAEGYGARRRREREATPDAAAVSFTRWSTTRSGKKTEDAPNAGERQHVQRKQGEASETVRIDDGLLEQAGSDAGLVELARVQLACREATTPGHVNPEYASSLAHRFTGW